MCELLAHRGSDGQGTYRNDDLGFGHRRLAVIDLTDAAHQPMVSKDGHCIITYNGEIYNFRELRNVLQGYGHKFSSQSDTEVILTAYQEYGVKCVEHLRGMFAFAIWDRQKQRLMIVRDRVGKKPLYYWLDKDGIAFASEPKAFLADPSFQPAPALDAISHYLTYQYVPSPWSAFQGVLKLPPGHILIVENGQIRMERYWQLSYAQTFRGSLEDASHELLHKLSEATKCRLISDVPLGAFLSGGIDSSVIVGFMAQLGSLPLKTFSIGFDQEKYNELPFARSVAERFGTDHQEFVVKPEPMKIFPKLTWHYNEPFADSSAIPSMYLAEMTRQHVTVALNGDGGDENLAGYDRYWASLLSHRYDRLPAFLRKSIERAASYLPEAKESKTLTSRVKRFASGLGYSPYQRYLSWVIHFDQTLKTELCTKEFLEASGSQESTDMLVDVFEQSQAQDLLNKTLDVDVQTYLPNDLLVKVDVATMAHGLEARSPFLDHEVMEFCASLPASMKLYGSVKKFVLKKAAKDLLPADILNRPKMGFGVPIDHWLRHELREMAYDILLSPRATQRGYFNRDVVERLLHEHANSERAWHYQIWNLLMLELWFRMFIDGEWMMQHQVT
ncbi:MAG: asparagine synthetase B [Nitrospirales bacterium]|nr:MAG: asparagine synthetase B [Nitrospirales bacterium]